MGLTKKESTRNRQSLKLFFGHKRVRDEGQLCAISGHYIGVMTQLGVKNCWQNSDAG